MKIHENSRKIDQSCSRLKSEGAKYCQSSMKIDPKPGNQVGRLNYFSVRNWSISEPLALLSKFDLPVRTLTCGEGTAHPSPPT